jgi:hypothetical protein
LALDIASVLDDRGPDSWDTVVHLGAGNGRDWRRVRSRLAKRIVLLEGDPDVAARLRAVSPSNPRWQVEQVAVAPRAGPVIWYGHDDPDFDGLVRHDRGAHSRTYTRIHCTGERRVEAESLAAFLSRVASAAASGSQSAVIVDIPLTDDDWLGDDGLLALSRFSRVVVTGAATLGQRGLTSLTGGLAAAGFMRREARGRPVCAVFDIDRVLHDARVAERRRMEAKTIELETALVLCRAGRDEVALDLAAAHERIRSLESSARQLRALRDETHKRHIEMQQAISRADAVLRTLAPLLGPIE